MTDRSAKLAVQAVFLTVIMFTAPVGGAVTALPASGAADSTAGTAPIAGAGHTTVASQVGPIRSAQPADSARPAGSVAPQKLGPGVQHQLAQSTASEKIPVIVVFETHPQERFNTARLSPQETRKKFRAFTRQNQAPLRSYLDRAQKRNRAQDIHSYWIRNMLAVEATPQTILNITRSNRVAQVVYDQQVTLNQDGTTVFGNLTKDLAEYGNITTRPTGFERATSGERAWSIEYVGADDVHERGITGQGVNVSVIDTGINETHPALQGQVILDKNFVNPGGDTIDRIGHGTHVAGTVAGRRDAKFAVGVAPGANLFDAKIFNETATARTSQVFAAFEWSANNSADVIQGSFGISPIVDSYANQTSAAAGRTTNVSFGVAKDFNDTFTEPGLDSALNKTLDGFKPSYVFVYVEPRYANGTFIENETRQARIMQNLTVTLRNPAGTRSLKKVEADWLYFSGEVPEQIGFFKFKPNTSRPIEDGNWTLSVTNTNDVSVEFEYDALPVYPSNGSELYTRTVNSLARDQGVVPVFSAGNAGILGNRSIGTPGAAEEALTIGASGYQTNDLTFFSSRGPIEFGSDTRPGIDLIAPGYFVLSSVPKSVYTTRYAYFSGTSMSAPHVSGTVALLLDADSTLSRSEIETKLESTAQAVPYGHNEVGAGVLDTWAAVNATIDLTARNVTTEEGVRELFAGLGDTYSNYGFEEIDLLRDAKGDAGTAPDIRVTHPRVTDEFEILTYDRHPNATFTVFIDADANDTTGDSTRRGAEYKLVLNRTYDPATDAFSVQMTQLAYNGTGYESTSDLGRPYLGSVNSRLLEVGDIQVAGRSETDPVEFHVVSSAPGTTDTDSIPDTGQAQQPVATNISGVAVAWNATAGAPDVDAPVTFTLYNESGVIVGRQTVRTNASGVATTDFTVYDTADYRSYTLEITDQHGNEIFAYYSVYFEDPEFAYDPAATTGYEANYRDYQIRPNSTLQLNIPVHNKTGSDLIPYEGKAAIQLDNGFDTYTVNNITVDNGVVRATVDFNDTPIEDDEYYVDIRVALRKNFSSAVDPLYGGNIEVRERDTVATQLSPFYKIAQAGQETTFAFQNVRYRQYPDTEPANVSVNTTTFWITNRQVAALFRDLPQSTVERLKQTRQLADSRAQASTTGRQRSQLTAFDRRQIREALGNLTGTNGVAINISEGRAAPTRRGIGTFGVTPPDDARYGFVYAEADTTDYASRGFGVVFVDDRVARYQRNQTEPDEDTRYFLDVEGYWDSHTAGNFRVPDENFTVRVGLYDTETDALVGGANVTLYTTGGGTRTVTTKSSGYVEVNLSAPDIDYVNASYYERNQQVLGVAKGYQTGDGRAVADDEFFYGFVQVLEHPGTQIQPLPYIRGHSQDTLHTEIDYEEGAWVERYNAWEQLEDVPANGTTTMVQVSERASPFWYFGPVKKDLNVSHITPTTTDTEVLLNVSAPVPARQREAFRMETTTGSIPWDWANIFEVEGIQANIQAPETFASGSTESVTVTVVDRNGDPVPNATVVFSYNDYIYSEDSFKAGGDTFIGTTSADGTVTFDVSVPARELGPDEERFVTYRAGVATANFSDSALEFGFADVTAEPAVTVTGAIQEPDTDPAAEDFGFVVTAAGDDFESSLRTNATGGFVVNLTANTSYVIEYFQIDEQNGSFVAGPIGDGVADLAELGPFNSSTGGDVGTFTVPQGHKLDVRVVNEFGEPVENATVAIQNASHGGGWVDILTNANGYMEFSGNATATGLDVVGRVDVVVRPPENATGFVERAYVRNLTVTSAREITVTLNQTIVQLNGTLTEPDGTPAAGDFVAASPEEEGGTGGGIVTTDSQGRFSTHIGKNDPVDVQFYQAVNGNFSEFAPRDGVVDMFAVARVNTSTPTTVNATLPTGSVLNVTVVNNRTGEPVKNATIGLTHRNGSADARLAVIRTDLNGRLNLSTNDAVGLELTGTVNVTVRPPADATKFKDQVYTRNLTITSDRDITVRLEEFEQVNTTVTASTAGTAKGGDVAVELNLTQVPRGLSGFTINVTVANGTVANFTGARYVAVNSSLANTTVSADGNTIQVKAVDLNDTVTTGATDVTLAELMVNGTAVGMSDLTIEVVRLDDETGRAMNNTTMVGRIRVRDLPKVDGTYPADPDGDGVYEDLNDNDRLDFDDLMVYFRNIDADVLTDYPWAYDANGNGRVDYDDLVTLFRQI